MANLGSGPPLLMLHGFTLTGEQFADTAMYLNRSLRKELHLKRSVVATDLPENGRSGTASTEIGVVIKGVAEVISALDPPSLCLACTRVAGSSC